MVSPEHIIEVGGGKGGIGKSIICINLALGLALRGKKVVLVDHSEPLVADMETYSIDIPKEKLAALDPKQVLVVESIVDSFKPQLIVKRVRCNKDLMAGKNLIELVTKYLGVKTAYLGYLIESDRVRDSVDEMAPFLLKELDSKPANNLHNILDAFTDTSV